MVDHLKIRIESDGPEAWKLKIIDAETGRSLPVQWGHGGHDIVLCERDGVLVARVDLVVWEIDLEMLAQVTETVEYLRKHDFEQPVRVR